MRSGTIFTTGLTALSVCFPLCFPTDSTAASDSPYQGIVARNVFSLKPPPSPVPIEEVKPPPPKIFLTGITSILGNKRALLKTPAPPAKPGQPPQGEQSYILAEGEREGDIEVISIDEKAGSVKVNNSGTLFVLNFDKDGQKPSAGLMPGGAPPPGVPVPGGITPPSVQPVNPYAPGSGFNLPSRPLRAGPGAAANTPSGIPAAGGYGNPAVSGGLSFGSGTVPGGAGVTSSDAAALAAATQRSAEETVALYEANRIKNQQLIQAGVRVPPMPPHVYLGGQEQQPAQQPVQTAPSLPFAPGIQQAQ